MLSKAWCRTFASAEFVLSAGFAGFLYKGITLEFCYAAVLFLTVPALIIYFRGLITARQAAGTSDGAYTLYAATAFSSSLSYKMCSKRKELVLLAVSVWDP